MLFNFQSVGPSTCGVFLSRVEVFLEGGLGQEAFPFVAPRGPSRFGQVNYWIDGQPPASVIPEELEKADLFILVGRIPEIQPRLIELKPYLSRPSCIAVIIASADPSEAQRMQVETGLDKLISINLKPDFSSFAGLVLDSLVALNYYYENALCRFSLFDLRHLWPDGIRLEVKLSRWQESTGSAKTSEVTDSVLTWLDPDLDSPHLLLVLRGLTDLTDQVMVEVQQRVFPSPVKRDTLFWYAVGQPPSSSPIQEIIVFSSA